jgi:hypothetical protein
VGNTDLPAPVTIIVPQDLEDVSSIRSLMTSDAVMTMSELNTVKYVE